MYLTLAELRAQLKVSKAFKARYDNAQASGKVDTRFSMKPEYDEDQGRKILKT